MNGYECPSCGYLIASTPGKMHDCPQCKASVETQKLAREYRRCHVSNALDELFAEAKQ